MNKNNSFNWLKNNFWNLFITFASIVALFVSLQGRVTATEKDIIAIQLRVQLLEKAIENLPSRDYLDVKFETIQSDLTEVKADVKKHLQQSQ